jgi:hypothetical protein
MSATSIARRTAADVRAPMDLAQRRALKGAASALRSAVDRAAGAAASRGRAKNPDHLRRDASALAPLAW